MKKYCYFLLLISSLLLSCKDAKNSSPSSEVNMISTENQRWMDFVNDKASLESVYLDSSIIIGEWGGVRPGASGITMFYNDFKKSVQEINSITTLKKVQASPEYEYELGYFTNIHGRTFGYLTVWNHKSNEPKREIEYISESLAHSDPKSEINQAREQWMTLCNQHNPEKLVKEMYASNASYYNYKPLINGIVAIANEYQYMKRDIYSLSLDPIITVPTSDNYAMEIGQCSGSYNGKYIIVWQKSQEKWKVLLDINL